MTPEEQAREIECLRVERDSAKDRLSRYFTADPTQYLAGISNDLIAEAIKAARADEHAAQSALIVELVKPLRLFTRSHEVGFLQEWDCSCTACTALRHAKELGYDA